MARQRESFLTTTQGVTLAKDDLVAFYMDPKLKAAPYYGVGCNVMVLKHAVSGNQVIYGLFFVLDGMRRFCYS